MKIELIKPTWKQVFQVPKGTIVLKGRHGIYKNVRAACRQVTNRFGCYSWQSAGQVHYCGSFTKDYSRAEFESNLEGRVHNYWQNHRVKKTGQKNTNKHVFDQISASVASSNVCLGVLRFDMLILDNQTIEFDEYRDNPDLVKAVEALVICHYRSLGQCTWNRT